MSVSSTCILSSFISDAIFVFLWITAATLTTSTSTTSKSSLTSATRFVKNSDVCLRLTNPWRWLWIMRVFNLWQNKRSFKSQRFSKRDKGGWGFGVRDLVHLFARRSFQSNILSRTLCLRRSPTHSTRMKVCPKCARESDPPSTNTQTINWASFNDPEFMIVLCLREERASRIWIWDDS